MLDLRGNGGGLIDVAFKIANAMTPDKGVTLAGVRYRDDMGGLDETVSTGGGLPLNKIVVLVNGGTASAAELLTGILQDTAENVTVVGEKTYGKGQGQMHLPLINGDKLVITTLEMELPGQGLLGGQGRPGHSRSATARSACARTPFMRSTRAGPCASGEVSGQYLRDDRASSAARPHRRADEHL